jgi:peptidoglycan/xylan/chitin deacetylase (PgdA/CDA1 family)
MIKVGIGVLSYNRPASLSACLDSLFNNLRSPASVAVSFDLWDSEFEAIAKKYPIWAVSGPQRGIPFANNRLLDLFSGYEAVFLVQDDIRFLRPEWFATYLHALNVIPYLAYFDTRYPESDNPRHWQINYFSRRQRVIRSGNSLWLCRKSPQGAFQALSRTCIERVGHYDTRFGVYGLEHNDYWQRICNAGLLPPDCFYDVADAAELLKIDWEVTPSLTIGEKMAAYQQSQRWRTQLFETTEEGFRRVKVHIPASPVTLHQRGPEYGGTPLTIQSCKVALAQEKWIYRKRLPVLAYHAVQDSPCDRYAISPTVFKTQIRELARHLCFATASQAVTIWKQQGCFPEHLAILTFDDGYQDFLTIASFLDELGIRATIFMPVNWIGMDNSWDRGAFTRRRHLDWDELRALVAKGHEVGSHGLEHVRLTTLLPDQAFREIIESQRILQEQLKQPACAIAYPFGSANISLAALAGEIFEVGFVTDHRGVLDWNENQSLIRRISVADEDAVDLCDRIAGYMTEAPHSESLWYPNRFPPQHSNEGPGREGFSGNTRSLGE